MRLPGTKRAKQAARWFRSRLMGKALILGYHRVAAVEQDPFAMCVHPEHFAEQLAVLRRSANPVRLNELPHRLQTGQLSPRAVVITFDDGYRDNLQYAKPLLERCGIPATVFITTGSLGRAFWWDVLEQSLRAPSEPLHRILTALDPDYATATTDPVGLRNDGLAGLRRIYQKLLRLPHHEQQAIVKQIASATTATETLNSAPTLTEAELKALADDGLIEVGSHSVTHPLLANLPSDKQQHEIVESKAYLEAVVQHPVYGFSYPNGSASADTMQLVREAGYTYACSSTNDVVLPGSNRYSLPRFWVPDCDGDQFARWLRAWLPG